MFTNKDPLHKEKQKAISLIENIHDQLCEHFNDQEFSQAKHIFFKEQGMAHEEHEDYDSRMQFFLDWCLAFYSNKLYHPTFFEQLAQRGTEDSFHVEYSIYQIKKVFPNKLIVYDLLNSKKIEMLPLGMTHNIFHIDQFFQSFAYSIGKRLYLSKGIIFHPLTATRKIQKKLGKHKRSKDNIEILNTLAKTQLKTHNKNPQYIQKLYTHISI